MSLMRKLREQKGLTSYQVAAAIGCNQSQYSRAESGARRASPDLADRIAKFFGNAITRDQILFPEDYATSGKKPVRRANLQPVAMEAQ